MKIENIQGIQTWGELLISTATSVLLKDAEVLSSKHLTLTEQMWFRELQELHYPEEFSFLKAVGNKPTKYSKNETCYATKEIGGSVIVY